MAALYEVVNPMILRTFSTHHTLDIKNSNIISTGNLVSEL